MVGHHVGGSKECPEISFDMVGSTGNIYKVVIGKVPTCDCPDGLRGNQCKHICYGTPPSFVANVACLFYPIHFY